MPNQTSVQIMDTPTTDPSLPTLKTPSRSDGNRRVALRPTSFAGRNTSQDPRNPAPASADVDPARPITVAVDRTVVHIPRIGPGSVSHQLFDQLEAADQAFILALMESVMAGNATRMVRSIVREICGTSIPEPLVRDRASRLDRTVRQWKDRSLAGQDYPFVFLTSADVSIRGQQGAAHRHSALIAAGISDEGYREVLGIDIVQNQPRPDWVRFLSSLGRRGMRGVDFVISSEAGGLTTALQDEFPQALLQRSQDQTVKSVLSLSPDSLQISMKHLLKNIFDSPSLQSALSKAKDIEELETDAPEAVKELNSCLPSALSVMALPATYRTRLRTTRLVDRIAQDVQRRAHVVRVFPTLDSAIRLVGSIATEVDHSWVEGQRYFSMESYRAWRKSCRSAVSRT